MTSEGELLNGRYRLHSRLGVGGMGSVWKAVDELLERTVALKELVPNIPGLALAESRARARREARAMARVRHPAIVRIHDLFSVEDDPWIVMEYISGRSLADIIRDEPLDERAIAAMGLPVLQGLRAAHAAKVVHRDVKPANIVVARDSSIFLVDFGIAVIDGDTSLTGQSSVLGTTEFIAPERLRGQRAGPPADLWSLGVTLFYALERYSPFLPRGERSVQATMAAILNADPPEPARRGKLAEVVLQMLRKEPSERPTGAQVEAVLEAVLDGAGRRGPTAATMASPARRQGGSSPDVALAGVRLADAVEIVSRSSTDSSVAMLLDMPDEQAARILDRCSRRVAGELIQAIAIVRPVIAAAILQIFAAQRAGAVLDYLSPGAAASILEVMPDGEALRILREADARTAAGALSEMPSRLAGQLLKVMPDSRSAAVLGHVKPASAADMLKAMPHGHRRKLLQLLSPAFRDLVMRYM